MSAIYLTEENVSSIFNMPKALELTEEAFRTLSEGSSFNMERQRMRIRKGALHLLPAAIPYKNVIGYKAYTSFRTGLRFRTFLHSAETGDLLAIIESNEIGRLRTGAASGVATKYMAKKGADSMLLYGAGYQAESQLEAIALSVALKTVYVTSRKIENAQSFAEKMSKKLNISVQAVADPDNYIGKVDIITTVTTSPKPLFSDDKFSANHGVHINAAGSNALIRQEIPEKTIDRASLLVVDNKDVAAVEAGDLLPSLEKGRIHWNEIVELGEIIAKYKPSRKNDEETTIFFSQGMGLLDLISAEYIYTRAVAEKIGIELPF